MNPDLDTLVTTLYVKVDDLLIANPEWAPASPAEARLLADPAVQIVEARAIADGIVRYLTTDDPGVGHNGVRRTGRILTTGGRYACVDPPLDLSTSHTSRYSTTEWAEVVAAANRRGETVADFQKASVRILAFLFGLSGKDPPRLAAHRQPANVGPHGATSSWSPDERAMLVRFASAFGLPTEQTQKIIAVGVAYILSLS